MKKRRTRTGKVRENQIIRTANGNDEEKRDE